MSQTLPVKLSYVFCKLLGIEFFRSNSTASWFLMVLENRMCAFVLKFDSSGETEFAKGGRPTKEEYPTSSMHFASWEQINVSHCEIHI